MSLKLYMDSFSGPCRALYITLKMNKVPFTPVLLGLGKGEHLSEDFTKNVSRFNKLHVISDDGFKLTESVAILRYLARTKNISDNWYSQDIKKQARIDEHLEWQHNNTRLYCNMYVIKKFLRPTFFGEEATPEELQFHKDNMEDCLEKLQTLWLTSGPYILGDQLTAADVWAACEVEQLRISGYSPTTGRDKLKNWLDKVKNETNPHYEEAHKLIYKTGANQSQTSKSKS